jgi:hypothetical protein
MAFKDFRVMMDLAARAYRAMMEQMAFKDFRVMMDLALRDSRAMPG